MDLQTMKTQMNTVIQKHQVSKVFIYVFLCDLLVDILKFNIIDREMNTETNKKNATNPIIFIALCRKNFPLLNESFWVLFFNLICLCVNSYELF